MWIFTTYGFFSVACWRDKSGRLHPETLMVRARSARHLKNLQRRFPAQLGRLKVEKWPGRDYGFRIIVEKKVWAVCVGELVMEQTWSNFKDAAASRGNDAVYAHALHAVWATMLEVQEGRRKQDAALYTVVDEVAAKSITEMTDEEWDRAVSGSAW